MQAGHPGKRAWPVRKLREGPAKKPGWWRRFWGMGSKAMILAYLANLGPERQGATASSPLTGFLE